MLAEPSLTRRMFEAVDARQSAGGQAGGAGGRTTYQALLAADQAWQNIRNMQVGVIVRATKWEGACVSEDVCKPGSQPCLAVLHPCCSPAADHVGCACVGVWVGVWVWVWVGCCPAG